MAQVCLRVHVDAISVVWYEEPGIGLEGRGVQSVYLTYDITLNTVWPPVPVTVWWLPVLKSPKVLEACF